VDAASVGDQRKLRSYAVECAFYHRLAAGLRDAGVTLAHPYLLEVREWRRSLFSSRGGGGRKPVHTIPNGCDQVVSFAVGCRYIPPRGRG
jgi:hypothetical protein